MIFFVNRKPHPAVLTQQRITFNVPLLIRESAGLYLWINMVLLKRKNCGLCYSLVFQLPQMLQCGERCSVLK